MIYITKSSPQFRLSLVPHKPIESGLMSNILIKTTLKISQHESYVCVTVSGENDDIFWKSNLPHNLKMDHIIYSTKLMQLPINSKIYDLFHFHITLLGNKMDNTLYTIRPFGLFLWQSTLKFCSGEILLPQ